MFLSRLRQVILNQSDFFTSREEGYCRRLIQWCDYSQELHHPDEYIAYLKGLGLVNFRPECRFLVKLYRRAGYDLSCFQEATWLRYQPPAVVTQSSSLVLYEELERGFYKLSGQDQVGLFLLAGTGRRSCDLNRLILIPRQSDTSQLTFRLPHQKNGNTHVIVQFKLHDSELPLINGLQKVRELYSANKRPNFNWNRIRRITRLKLHALRNRFAIRLMIEGVSEEMIMDRLGWRDRRSLRRYVRLSYDFVSSQNSADSVVHMLRELY